MSNHKVIESCSSEAADEKTFRYLIKLNFHRLYPYLVSDMNKAI